MELQTHDLSYFFVNFFIFLFLKYVNQPTLNKLELKEGQATKYVIGWK